MEKITAATMYMNTLTGSVDTAENWALEGYTLDNSDLMEVVSDGCGWWLES